MQWRGTWCLPNAFDTIETIGGWESAPVVSVLESIVSLSRRRVEGCRVALSGQATDSSDEKWRWPPYGM